MRKGLIAQERDRADIRLARRDRTVRRQPFMRDRAHRLVFLDETSVKANMTRLRGRSAVGERLFGTTPFGRWKTQTFIAGLTCDALIAPRVIEGAMNRAAFDIHVETRLAPALWPGTVFVGNSIHWIKSFSSSSLRDTLSTHRSPKAAGILNAHGCRFRSRGKPSTGGLSDPSNLPAYSPDPNPIERAFSKPKAHLRRIGARSYDTLIRALGDICGIFDPEECWSFFKAAGYASN